jgi:hypothetical protein
MNNLPFHGYFRAAMGIALLIIVSGSGKSFAQNDGIHSSSEEQLSIPLTTFDYNNVPFKIGGPVNLLVTDEGFRAKYEIENTSDHEISSLHLWLLVYYPNRSKPVLFERKLATSIQPGTIKNFTWDGPQSEYGNPVSGTFTPYTIQFSDRHDWNLLKYYSSDGNGPLLSSEVDTLTADSFESSPYHRTMKAVRVLKGPKIDGVLDDSVWEQAEFTGDFIQRLPDIGAPATETTEVAIIYDDDNLIFGARLYDSEPDKIVHSEMRRDGPLLYEDLFEIVLDTYHDHRNAFNFVTNPAGARIDATLSEDGKIRNRVWNGVWNAKTSIDEKGWYIEIEIPWQMLRFPEGNNLVMGINFIREIQRKNESDFWRFVPLYAGVDGQFRTSEAGDVTGFNGLKRGGNFEIKPFMTGGVQRDDLAEDELGEVGIDIKANITSTLTADFTYNTDFAQVETDQEQINLTRFSLFFPEKRDFFLEGAETFAFGQSRGGIFRPLASPIQLFHSRTIGISEGNAIPVIGGARLNGKVGDYTLGLVSIQTEKTNIVDEEDEPETNFSAFRLKRNIFSRSTVGIMLLNKEEIDGGFNRSVGFDSNFNINEKLSFYFVGAGTYSPDNDLNRRNFAGHTGFRYQGDMFSVNAGFLDIEKSFNPEMGFVQRTDIKNTEGSITFSPRPKRWPSIRQLFFTANGMYQTDGGYRALDKKVGGLFSIHFQNDTRLQFKVDHQFEYLDEYFEIRPAIILPQSEYSWTTAEMTYSTGNVRKISGSLSINGGELYNGTSLGGGISTNIYTMGRIVAQTSYNYNEIKLTEGKFHTNKLTSRIYFTFTTDLYIKGFFQWVNDDLLFENRDRIGQNILVRYTYKPGSDFFLVYNQENLVGMNNGELSNRTFLAKFTYLLRK